MRDFLPGLLRRSPDGDQLAGAFHGRALECINFQVTNPGATVSAVTANTGDSLTVRSTNFGVNIDLLQAWAFTTTNLLLRIRSPRMHDQAQNMRFQPTASLAYPLMPWGGAEPLYPQDPLTVEMTGGAAEVDIGALLVYYADLPGVSARLHTLAEISPLIQHLTTVEVDLTAAGTSGNYSATVALNGTFDTLIRNRTYAILGYESPNNLGSIGIKGADTGNLRVGGPLLNIPYLTSNWFVRLANEYQLPLIPVFNSANVAGILVDCTQQGTATNPKVAFNLALLSDPNNL